MALTDRNSRFQMTDPDAGAERPEIWVDGRQRSRFDFRAYAATSLGMAKRDLRPEMKDAEVRLTALGERILRGEMRVNAAWLRWAQPALPSHQKVGSSVLGLARTFADASRVLSPEVAGDDEMAHSDVYRKLGAATKAAKPVHTRPKDATAPEAIRKMKRSIPNTRALELGLPEIAPQIGEGDEEPARSWLNDRMRRAFQFGAARMLLWIMVAFALPLGAIKALMFHLNGGDLADWS